MKNWITYFQNESLNDNNNNIYYAYLKQKGEGCDYTIGCAQTLIPIMANSFDEAIDKLKQIINDEYYDDTELEKALIFPNKPYELDLDSIYNKRQMNIDRIKQEQEYQKELDEYNRLKQKFENN